MTRSKLVSEHAPLRLMIRRGPPSPLAADALRIFARLIVLARRTEGAIRLDPSPDPSLTGSPRAAS